MIIFSPNDFFPEDSEQFHTQVENVPICTRAVCGENGRHMEICLGSEPFSGENFSSMTKYFVSVKRL